MKGAKRSVCAGMETALGPVGALCLRGDVVADEGHEAREQDDAESDQCRARRTPHSVEREV
jgi:hypothetical protein